MPRHSLILVCLLPLVAAALSFGCDEDSNGGSATATDTLQATATPAPVTDQPGSPTPAPDIRQEDLTQQAGLQEFLSTSGGTVDPAAIIYDDLTQDGVEDAVVPVSSGGEGGNIALFVYSYQPAGLEEVLRVLPEMSLTAGVVAGTLQVTQPVYAEGDPMCCPSQTETTTYQWDGRQLVPSTEAP
jgi:hypothetical protein